MVVNMCHFIGVLLPFCRRQFEVHCRFADGNLKYIADCRQQLKKTAKRPVYFSIVQYEILMTWNMLMYQKNFQARFRTPSGFLEQSVCQIR